MTTYVLINNEKYYFAFKDSVYAFNKDLEYTIKHYCSLREIGYYDIGTQLFVIHSHISKLRFEDNISEYLIDKYNLNCYGEGPNYENGEHYYIISGYNIIKKICVEFLLLETEIEKHLLKIYKSDFESFCFDKEQLEILEVGEVINFDEMTPFIFVSETNKQNIIQFLNQDINNLNNLFSELNMKDRIISIKKPKLH